MKQATKSVLYFETGPDNPVTLRVRPGEEFEVETQLNRGPWLDDHPEEEKLRNKLADGAQPRETMFGSGWSVPWYLAAGMPGGNPSSGCIYVEGAKPGDVLLVYIGGIDLDPIGYTAYPGPKRRRCRAPRG
jgi:acetamidase/formamidase